MIVGHRHAHIDLAAIIFIDFFLVINISIKIDEYIKIKLYKIKTSQNEYVKSINTTLKLFYI